MLRTNNLYKILPVSNNLATFSPHAGTALIEETFSKKYFKNTIGGSSSISSDTALISKKSLYQFLPLNLIANSKFSDLKFLNLHVLNYPTPVNLNYFWSLGSLSAFFLMIQIFTGVLLSTHYVADVEYAFFSVEYLVRYVPFGWLFRSMHANGASFFFIVVYLHIARGFWYCSFLPPRQWVWITGVVIFLLMMTTAFMGYVLPWGQMSFWGAIVITNFLGAVPYLGQDIAYWVWGGFNVGNATLHRFYGLHYLFPFIILGLFLVHLLILHVKGSNNSIGVDDVRPIPLYSHFIVKDFFVFFAVLVVYFFIVIYYPDVLGHPDNAIEANPLVTPTHIVPEWYFLPFYGILRSIPNKTLGIVFMGLAVIIWVFLPWLMRTPIRSPKFRPFYAFFVMLFFLNFIFLGKVGGSPVSYTAMVIGRITTFYYFLFFLVLVPLSSLLDTLFLYRFFTYGKESSNYYQLSDLRVSDYYKDFHIISSFKEFLFFLSLSGWFAIYGGSVDSIEDITKDTEEVVLDMNKYIYDYDVTWTYHEWGYILDLADIYKNLNNLLNNWHYTLLQEELSRIRKELNDKVFF